MDYWLLEAPLTLRNVSPTAILPWAAERRFKDDAASYHREDNLNLTRGTSGPVFVENIPAMAIWIPAKLGASWLVQDSA